MPIQWTKDLILGIPELDAQHLELDRQLALVHDALCAGRVPDLSAVLVREHQRYDLQLVAYAREADAMDAGKTTP